ncbi:MAG: hypothetical protein EPN79_01425 [Burkholderiaceae bacterium]|nr:MAG: hypothetical protein EPN79_01425 [Burkholderiaceae bacterium]TBR75689.1 MAG: hypothetical protein EPN64_11520 [Burkholderiaceae bacterium]
MSGVVGIARFVLDLVLVHSQDNVRRLFALGVSRLIGLPNNVRHRSPTGTTELHGTAVRINAPVEIRFEDSNDSLEIKDRQPAYGNLSLGES